MSDNDKPFGTIESTQKFLSVLSGKIDEVLADARRELSASMALQRRKNAQAWQVVLYTTTKLSSHIEDSRRLMSDLLTVREFLHGNSDR